jgi:pimeloyl-ACP methyl ester carboxylesterase
VIAPVAGPIITSESIEGISVPLSIIGGENDDQSIPEQTAIPISRRAPNATLQIVPKAHHYTYLSEGTFWSRLVARDLFRDPIGLNRRQLHDKIAAEAAEFFRVRL